MSDEEVRDVPAAQQAMKQLTQYINATELEVRRLRAAETHLDGRVNMLTISLNGAERQLLESREEVRRLAARDKRQEQEIRELTSRVERGDEALRRRAEEAEAKAAEYGSQNEELVDKAALGERLFEAGQKVTDAIDRLPTKMEDATMIRATPGPIPLFDTYEWQAVSDARFLLLRALGLPTGEPEVEEEEEVASPEEAST